MEPVIYAVVVILISFWSPGNVQVVFECLHSLENLDTCVNCQVICLLLFTLTPTMIENASLDEGKGKASL